MKNSTQVIGRETMISRIIFFHTDRLKRVFKDSPLLTEKLSYFNYSEYKNKNTQYIRKEYDDLFSKSTELLNTQTEILSTLEHL